MCDFGLYQRVELEENILVELLTVVMVIKLSKQSHVGFVEKLERFRNPHNDTNPV